MISPVENFGSHCPDPRLLEEYAVRHAKGMAPDSPDLDDHLSACKKCRDQFKKNVTEALGLIPLLATPSTAFGICLPLEELGCYLDGTLSPADRIHAESHLAHCSQCKTALTELSQETSALLEEEANGLPVMAVEAPDDLRNHPTVSAKSGASSDMDFNMEKWLDTHESPQEKAPAEMTESTLKDGLDRRIGRHKH
ncbi:MAG TPA: zf-HC2 domain-containing protein [Candidatus Hydrogenedentes bacterium]|nr:zf-HC2 domain-containing protein [Candidatus Hydrogenedentota bacterium]HRT20710.1 zf-HC2 domain-containing protein [Candidatus Hydrogenedentota bacterium]HRT66170.1 zf-HC2 domain-containing protein [Candidatus Hydrogenedentota bacterium]